MIFFIEPLENEGPVSCLELSPAISLPRLLERSTPYVLPSTLKTSEFTSDKWVQTDLPVPVPAHVLRLGIVARSKAEKSWVNTYMISPHQGMWPGAAVSHGTDIRPLLVYTSPKKNQFGALVVQLLTWLTITQAQSLGSCSVCFRAYPMQEFVLLWQEGEGGHTWGFCRGMCLGLFKSTDLLHQCEASVHVLNQSFPREVFQVLCKATEKLPHFGLVFHTGSFQITHSWGPVKYN